MGPKMRRIAIDSSSTVDLVVDALRREMFAGRLTPGEQLREVELAGTFDVARSTVREALQVLVAEGLATRVRNRGVAVRQLTIEDVDDLYRARCVLEIAGIRNTPRAPRAALEIFGQRTVHDGVASGVLLQRLDVLFAAGGFSRSGRENRSRQSSSRSIRSCRRARRRSPSRRNA